MPSGHAYSKAVRTVKTCVGTEFCRFGLGDAIDVGIELERAMEGLHTPHKVKAAVTGCPRNCSEAYVKDIGLVAVEGGWEIYVGGAAGAHRAQGRPARDRRDRARRRCAIALAFLQHYREHGEHLERTYGYIERVGLEAVQEAVLDPDGGRPRCSSASRSPRPPADPDPWRERRDAGPPQAVRRARLRARGRSTRRGRGRRRDDAHEPSHHGWIVVGRASDVPLLEGRSVDRRGRRIAVFRTGRRLGRGRRRLPARGRAAAGRARRRRAASPARCTTAASTCDERRAPRRGRRACAVTRSRSATASSGSRLASASLGRRVSAPARSAPAAPTAAPAAG